MKYKNLIEKNINKFSSNIFLIDEKNKPVTFGKIFLKPERNYLLSLIVIFAFCWQTIANHILNYIYIF